MHVLCQLCELLPVLHVLVFGAHLRMAVLDVLAYECVALQPSVEYDAARQPLGHSCQPFYPAVEAHLEFYARRHSHHDAPHGGQRPADAADADLSRYLGDEPLRVGAPEAVAVRPPVVHAHDDLAGIVLHEGVLDAVGNVGSQSALRLHAHVGRCGGVLCTFQHTSAGSLVLSGTLVVVDHVEPYEPAVQPVVAHHDGQLHQVVGVVVVLQRQQQLLVVALRVLVVGAMQLLAQQYALRCPVDGDAADDAREEYHHHHAVHHRVVHQASTLRREQVHAHHDHSDGACGVGGGESEHHVPLCQPELEDEARQVGGNGLAERAEEHHAEHDADGGRVVEHDADVDEHAHADEEVGYEQGVADELQPVHERRHAWNEAVQDQTGQEGAEDALQSAPLADGSAEKHHREHIDVEHDGIVVLAEEPARQPGQQQRCYGRERHHLDGEQQPEPHVGLALIGCREGG